MHKTIARSLQGILALALLQVSALAAAAPFYEITITNLTRGQVFSPPLIATHRAGIKLFTVGEAASPGLAALAQDGLTAGLAEELSALPEVNHVEETGAPIPPGESMTIVVPAEGGFNHISVAAMAVSTNDAFIALNGVEAPRGLSMTRMRSPGYDAGAEGNDEMCAYIPGPPCGDGTMASSGVGAEGYVHVHAGIRGDGDLSKMMADWRNPMADIKIQRIKQ